jgi:hypothetical protein
VNPAEIARAHHRLQERRNAREAAARALGFASFAAYHRRRSLQCWMITDMARGKAVYHGTPEMLDYLRNNPSRYVPTPDHKREPVPRMGEVITRSATS